MTDKSKAYTVLAMNTLAFTVCFACWMLNGVLVTFLVENEVYRWTETQIGLLIGIPVLTGSVMRLPVGILTDKYGGRPVYILVMLASAVPMYMLSMASEYYEFLAASFGFGVVGASFAVGIAYTSVWFPKHQQGTALGIFGAGNAGAALTSLLAPSLLLHLTSQGTDLNQWRTAPKLYAALLVAMAVLFYLFTHPKIADQTHITGFMQRLEPLRHMRVWRFGLYYFFVFGGFVALSQWLIPYYVNAYSMSVAMAGAMASIFSLPSGVIRALGGWMSDRYGARRVMYWVLGSCLICCALLIVPRMEVQLPGKGVMAARGGVVGQASDDVVTVGTRTYQLESLTLGRLGDLESGVLVLPSKSFEQRPVVKEGDKVVKRQLLARGLTHIHFQANVWIFTAFVFIIGFMMGIGKAAVYRHIPDYFPQSVGVVGGMVGVIGGLGGFFSPVIFGWLLERTGIWTTAWMFLTAVAAACLIWMHLVVQRMMREEAPQLMRQMETGQEAIRR
ncbi:MAG: MFS transporter [Acidobacteriia bacterium]|nr:MFS transporter [Terriglobia bacterium]